MRTFALLLLTVGVTWADDEKKPNPPPTRYAKALELHEKKVADLTAAFDAAVAKEKEIFAAKALKLIVDFPTDPGACDGVAYLLANGSDEQVGKTLELVAGKLMKSAALAVAVPGLADRAEAKAEEILRSLAADSPHPTVRGPAYFHLGLRLLNSADEDSTPPATAKKLLADAETALKQATKFSVPDPATPEDPTTIASAANAKLEALALIRKLAIGNRVPDESVRIGDKTLPLRDLQGKVVVLKYGAGWCGPCRAMKPHQKQIEARLADKPFVYLDVDVDANPEIAERWNLRTIPRVFVLDVGGVIRFKGVRGDDLDKAVDLLLKEAAGK